jgi:uncharacterized protein YndB with AHSA1/START domain
MNNETVPEAIVIEFEVRAPVERVFKAWTDPSELTRWLTEKAIVDVKRGGSYELFWDLNRPDLNSTIGCRITDLEMNRMIAFDWKGPVPYADLMNVEPLPTSVIVRMDEVRENHTAVRLEHTGWGVGPRWNEARQWQENAWKDAINLLLNHCET